MPSIVISMLGIIFGAPPATATRDSAPRTAGLAPMLRFSDQTGGWAGLRLADPPVELLADSAEQTPTATLHVKGCDVADVCKGNTFSRVHSTRQGLLEVTRTSRSAQWSSRSIFRVDERCGRITRRVGWTYTGDDAVEVSRAVLRVPRLRFDGDPTGFCLLPAAWPARPTTFAALQPGRRTSESNWLTGQSGIMVAHAPKLGLSVFVGHELSLDGAIAGIEEESDGINLCHYLKTTGRIVSGQTWDVGIQHIQIVRGDWQATLSALADFSESLGNGPPPDSPQWLDRCVVYSCYPHGPIDAGFNAGGGFAGLEKQLAYLAKLGANTIWLNPTYTEPPGIYTIHDHRAVAGALGTEEDLKRFVRSAHTLGLRVWLDLVSHGPAQDSPDARKAPPEAWARNRDGSLCMSWGTNLTGDYSHPAWQTYMSDVAAYWVERFGIDGFRHDCGFGSSGLNWSPDSPYRPSAAAPFGGVMMTQAVRNRIRRIRADAAVFSETGGPLFFRSADLIYDYPFYLACRELTYGTTIEQWIPRMRRWLQLYQATYPRRTLRGLVRFVENHDTVRATRFFGVGPAQALTALAIFCRGTPMLYQEQEIGFGPVLRDWLALRNRLPALHLGSADYEAVHSSDPGVLPILRRTDTAAAVAAVNLSGRTVQTTLSWPAEIAEALPVIQSIETGRSISTGRNGCTVTIPAYRTIVLALRTTPADGIGSRQSASSATSTSPPVTTLVAGESFRPLTGGQTEYRITLHPATDWYVETAEGVLADEFVERHRPGPFPTREPCWRPLGFGLWDTTRWAAIGFRSADGRAVRIGRIDVPRLVDARIEDASNVGRDVQVVLVTHDRGDRPYEISDGLSSNRSAIFHPCQGVPEPAQSPSAALQENASANRPPSLFGKEGSRIDPLSAQRSGGPLTNVDPFYVMLENAHYRLRLARRHGGTIAALELGNTELPHVDAAEVSSDLYSDWGLYAKGRYAGTREEPKPRLTLHKADGRCEVTFTGRLKGSSWNGVQQGHPLEPPTRYRLAYQVNDSPVVLLTFGLTGEVDRPATGAFFALRWRICGVRSWSVATGGKQTSGRPGERTGQRVFESALLTVADAEWTISLHTSAGRIILRRHSRAVVQPANTFLLDHGPDTMDLFVALLNGNPVDLKADKEYATTVELVLNPHTAH